MDSRKQFVVDDYGSTALFAAAEQGRYEEVTQIIFSLAGTGFAPPRLTLIAIEDIDGLTAADVAERGGHDAIADLLRGERARMDSSSSWGGGGVQRRTGRAGCTYVTAIRLGLLSVSNTGPGT